MLNFNQLPQKKPERKLLDNGFYKAIIENAEMRTPKNPKSESKDYLSVTYNLFDKDNKPCGKFWDNFFEADKDIPRYKIARFLNALHIVLDGDFELKDISKIIKDKQLVVDIGTDEKNDPPRNQVDVFEHEIYYPIEEWAALGGNCEAPAIEQPAQVSPATTERSTEY